LPRIIRLHFIREEVIAVWEYLAIFQMQI
jgi:hypothetical protein